VMARDQPAPVAVREGHPGDRAEVLQFVRWVEGMLSFDRKTV
jgi:hypothetical protein